jgi:hypothetical protein
MSRNFILTYASATTLAVSLIAAPASAQNLGDWDWRWEIYGWLPTIKQTTANGVDVKIDKNDILDNLDFTFQTNLSATRGDWTLFADGVYMNLGGKDRASTSEPIGNFGRVDVEVDAKIDIKSVISTFGGGYKFYENHNTKLNAVGGVRYTYLKVGIDAEVDGVAQIDLLGNTFKRKFKDQIDLDESESFWDGVIGLQGETKINDRWTFLYYGDIGTGDSDLTWQASAGFRYAFERFDLTLRYRHLHYNFGKNDLAKELTVSGPQVGILFEF